MFRKQCYLLLSLVLIVNLHGQQLDFEPVFTHRDNSLSYRTVDFNNDGISDIFGESPDGFELYMGIGDGAYSHNELISFDRESSFAFELGAFELVDVDNDGDKDVIYIGAGGDLRGVNWYENIGGTELIYREEITSQFGGLSSPRMAVADLDNDGDEDLVMTVASGFDGLMLAIYFEGGSFEVRTIFEDSDDFFNDLILEDVEGDGDIDIIGADGSTVSVYTQSNDMFEFAYEARLGVNGTQVLGNDSDGNLQVYGTSGRTLILYTLDESGLLNEETVFAEGNNGDTRYFLYDHGSDGDLDIFHGTGVSTAVFFIENIQGAYVDPVVVAHLRNGMTAGGVLFQEDEPDKMIFFGSQTFALGVLSGIDGSEEFSLDVLTGLIISDHLKLSPITPDDNLEIMHIVENHIVYTDYEDIPRTKTLFSADVIINDALLSDLNGDGEEDLIVLLSADASPQTDTTLVWYEGSQPPFDNPQLILADEFDVEAILSHDFDNDGDIDIVALTNNQSPFLFTNDGSGQFDEESLPASRSDDGKLLDVDMDGFMDVLGWDYGGSLQYLRNNTMGSFERRVLLGSSNRCFNADGVDFDADGDLDFVAQFVEGDGLRLFVNDNNEFTEVTLDPDYFGPVLGVPNIEGVATGFLLSPLSYNLIQSDFSLQSMALDAELFIQQAVIGPFNDRSGLELVVETEEGIYVTETSFGGFDCPFISLNIGDPCDDNNPNTINDLVLSNCICQGESSVVDADGDGVFSDEDCDDNNPDVFPGASEICNGIDDNCDGGIDENLTQISQYRDDDGDGFGAGNIVIDCMVLPGHVTNNADCNDNNSDINPNAIEIPNNGIDDDCNGMVDDVPGQFPFREIGDLVAIDGNGNYLSDQEQVTVIGVVHTPNFLAPSNLLFSIIDDNRDGLFVFEFGNDINFDPEAGDRIEVQGALSQFNGILEIIPESIIIRARNEPLFVPREVSDLTEETEADVIEIRDVELLNPQDWLGDGSSFNVVFTDGSNIHASRIYTNTYWSNQPAPVGRLSVRGIGGQFDTDSPFFDNYMISPRWESDIDFLSNVSDEKESTVRVYPNPTSRYVHIESSDVYTQAMVYSMAGSNLIDYNDSEITQLDLNELNAGIYIIEFYTSSGQSVVTKIALLD